MHVSAQAILLLEALPAAAGPLLAKLHSNRAAARLMRHAPQEGLADCATALKVRGPFKKSMQLTGATKSRRSQNAPCKVVGVPLRLE